MICDNQAFRVLFALPLLMVMTDLAVAEDKQLPEDECVVELTLPEGSTVNIDGDDYGTKRKMMFRPLSPSVTYSAKVLIQFPSGEKENHVIFLQGGRRVRLARQDPTAQRPELALQTGHSSMVKAVAFSPDGKYVATGSGASVAEVQNRPTFCF